MAKGINRDDITGYLDTLLHSEPVVDVAVNGLQFPGKKNVKKIAVCVDATLDTLKRSVEWGADMVFVHHGIFWTYQKAAAIDDIKKEYYKLLVKNDLSLYASHLPLDRHIPFGNNFGVINHLGRPVAAEEVTPFCNYKGTDIGLYTDSFAGLTLPELAMHIEGNIGSFRVYPARPDGKLFADSIADIPEEPVGRLGVITGAGQEGLEVGELNTFITGEVAHYTVARARELGVNLIVAGHYATETFGVQSIGRHLTEHFGIDSFFIDAPSGI